MYARDAPRSGEVNLVDAQWTSPAVGGIESGASIGATARPGWRSGARQAERLLAPDAVRRLIVRRGRRHGFTFHAVGGSVAARPAGDRQESRARRRPGARPPLRTQPGCGPHAASCCSPTVARGLLEDRALWATAFYAGLRRGELQALTWDGLDLAGGLISVERSWDQEQGPVEPKSAAGFRRTPIAAVLRYYLVQHRVTHEKDKRALVFGRADGTPFSPSTVAQRAERAWKAMDLEPVTLHE